MFQSNILTSLKIAEFRTPTSQDVQKKGSKILKLPPVHNCFTLTITNKLVVIINSLKYQKFRKFYYMNWNFLYQTTAASRTPDYGATAPRSPFSLSSVLNWICWTPTEKNSWVRHCVAERKLSKNHSKRSQPVFQFNFLALNGTVQQSLNIAFCH